MRSLELLKYAYVKGFIISNNITNYLSIANKPLDMLTSSDLEILDNIIKEYELKTYYFKEKEVLPRVKIILGFFKP